MVRRRKRRRRTRFEENAITPHAPAGRPAGLLTRWAPLAKQSCPHLHLAGAQRTDAEAEAPIPWPPDTKRCLIGKDPDAGRDWRQEEKGTIEDEMLGWHHRLNGHESEQAPGDGEGQGSLACCMQSMGSQSQTWLSDWTAKEGKHPYAQ